MVAALRQHATGYAGPGVTSLSATLSSAALADSALLWIVGGDKDIGTVTKPAACPNLPIDIHSADVTLALAWGTAAGGETAVAGSCASNIAGTQVWVLEITDTDSSNPWALQLTVQLVSAGGNVTTVVIGPSGSAARAGLGVAAAAFDSVNTAGTSSWTNSWTERRTTASGGGNAGLWGATKDVSAGSAETTTFDRAGGTADQAHGLLVVVGRSAGSTSGAVAASSPAPAAAITGTVRTAGAAAASAPAPTASSSGTATAAGAVAGSTSSPTLATAGAVKTTGATAATAAATSAAVAAAVRQTGSSTVTTPPATAVVAGTVRATGAVAGGLPAMTGSVAAVVRTTGAVAAALPSPAASLAPGGVPVSGVLAASTPAPALAVAGLVRTQALVATRAPLVAATVSGLVVLPAVFGVFGGHAPAPAANVSGVLVVAGTFVGAAPRSAAALRGVLGPVEVLPMIRVGGGAPTTPPVPTTGTPQSIGLGTGEPSDPVQLTTGPPT